MKINRDFRELLECLVAGDVRFLVVGGYALAAHGLPRYTKDIDIWICLPEMRLAGEPVETEPAVLQGFDHVPVAWV